MASLGVMAASLNSLQQVLKAAGQDHRCFPATLLSAPVRGFEEASSSCLFPASEGEDQSEDEGEAGREKASLHSSSAHIREADANV